METTQQTKDQNSVRGCCGNEAPARQRSGSLNIDWMLWGSFVAVAIGYGGHIAVRSDGHGNAAHFAAPHNAFAHYAAGTFEMMNTMWWGIALGILFVGLLERVPRDIVITALASNRRASGILRATAAGVLFDLCSHGILMVGMKLYERGASIGQTVAFLLASPWNSFSLTLILIALVGWQYTLVFIILSALIAIVAGYIFDTLVDLGYLPDNPARANIGELKHISLTSAIRQWLSGVSLSWQGCIAVLRDGIKGSRMVLRWLLFGVVIAAVLRATVPSDIFADWFGPTLLGAIVTILAATLIEVCSEGSAPIASDLISRASAPGNAFAFLMAGVATDYTEIMSIKDTTGSWKLALALPLISVPQTLAVAIALNALA